MTHRNALKVKKSDQRYSDLNDYATSMKKPHIYRHRQKYDEIVDAKLENESNPNFKGVYATNLASGNHNEYLNIFTYYSTMDKLIVKGYIIRKVYRPATLEFNVNELVL